MQEERLSRLLTPTVRLAFDARADDGGFVPNGASPSRWRAHPHDEPPADGGRLDFWASPLPRWAERAGFRVERLTVDEAAGGPAPWFYLLRPYAVPYFQDVFSALSPALRSAMDRGEAFVLVDYTHEGFSEWMFLRLYEALGEVRLPPSQVVLVSGDLNVEALHRRFLAERGVTDGLRVHPLNYFKNQVADHLATPAYRAEHVSWEAMAAPRPRRRRFLNFNRRNRLHRVLAAVALDERGLLDAGLVSLPAEFEGRRNEEACEDEAARFELAPALLQRLRRGYPRLSPRLPLEVDVDEQRTNHAHTHATWPYLESWFSLVSETLFFESAKGQVFLSEKIWKPMVNFHPFVVLGDQGTLAALRQQGFATFAPLIDESYDAEEDHARRFDLVLAEVERLCGLSDEALHAWLLELGPALRHNHALLARNELDERFAFWNAYLGPR